MKLPKPEYQLQRIYNDGTQSTPEIYRSALDVNEASMNRRGFVGAGIGIASALSLLRNAPIHAAEPPPLLVFAHTNVVRSLAMAQDSRYLASASDDKLVKLWSILESKLVRVMSGHTDYVRSLAFAPDGKTLASGSHDNSVRIWSIPDGQLVRTLIGHTGHVLALCTVPDGSIVISASDDRSIRFWSSVDGKSLRSLTGHTGAVISLAVSPDGTLLASGSGDNTIRLWSIPHGSLLAVLNGHSDDVLSLRISTAGSLLVSGSTDASFKLWSLPEGRLIQTVSGQGGSVSSLAISPDGRLLFSGTSDNSIRAWALPGCALRQTVKIHQNQVNSLEITTDGKILASGSGDRSIRLWNVAESSLSLTLLSDTRFAKLTWDGTGTLEESSLVDGPWTTSKNQKTPQTVQVAEPRRFYRLKNDLPQPAALDVRSFLFDPAADNKSAVSYNRIDSQTGALITYTMPCGSPIPTGAACVCNCVPGTYTPPATGGGSSGGGTICTCNKICSCIPVYFPSDRDLKDSFAELDPQWVLNQLSSIPIKTWKYTAENSSIRHVGPMAQDFARAFSFGHDDRIIHIVDAHGVAFSAIQALHALVGELKQQIQVLQEEVFQLRSERR